MADLANLRRAHVRDPRRLRETEALPAGYKDKLETIETAICAIDLELKLPLQHRNYSPIFNRGEYTRFTLNVLRQAGEPLSLAKIAIWALAVKGSALPDARLRKITPHRLSMALVVFQDRGGVEKVGSPNKLRWRRSDYDWASGQRGRVWLKPF